jgi:hypothetical protein
LEGRQDRRLANRLLAVSLARVNAPSFSRRRRRRWRNIRAGVLVCALAALLLAAIYFWGWSIWKP